VVFMMGINTSRLCYMHWQLQREIVSVATDWVCVVCVCSMMYHRISHIMIRLVETKGDAGNIETYKIRLESLSEHTIHTIWNLFFLINKAVYHTSMTNMTYDITYGNAALFSHSNLTNFDIYTVYKKNSKYTTNCRKLTTILLTCG